MDARRVCRAAARVVPVGAGYTGVGYTGVGGAGVGYASDQHLDPVVPPHEALEDSGRQAVVQRP